MEGFPEILHVGLKFQHKLFSEVERHPPVVVSQIYQPRLDKTVAQELESRQDLNTKLEIVASKGFQPSTNSTTRPVQDGLQHLDIGATWKQ